MAIGERIRYFRNLRGMTQKELGIAVDFDEKSADVRIAQYESGSRTPKEELIKGLAYRLSVSPLALKVPDIDTDYGLMHTLFTLEDLYGLRIDTIDGELCLSLDKTKGPTYNNMYNMLNGWRKERNKLKLGDITEDEYDAWRYTYPEINSQRTKAELDARWGDRKKNPD
jgi:transcriptional regulator with XRE-family HTH domain